MSKEPPLFIFETIYVTCRGKFEFEDTIVWVFVMHSSVEMVTKRLYLQIGAQKKARFFSLMYFCESLCINRISHNYVILQFLFCIIMPFRTSFHIPFRKLIPPFTLTALPGSFCQPKSPGEK